MSAPDDNSGHVVFHYRELFELIKKLEHILTQQKYAQQICAQSRPGLFDRQLDNALEINNIQQRKKIIERMVADATSKLNASLQITHGTTSMINDLNPYGLNPHGLNPHGLKHHDQIRESHSHA